MTEHSPLKLLLDVDALCKLAHWGLLDVLPSLVKVAWSECATLESAKHRARRATEKPDGRIFKTTAAAQEAVRAIDMMREELSPSMSRLAEFEDVSAIDPGEAVLLTVLKEIPQCRLLTGDKRALRALSEIHEKTRTSYAGRILLVEQVVLAALEMYGLQWLRDHVCPEKAVDKAISIAMGSRCDASEPAVREGLLSYINEMQQLYDPSVLGEI